MSERRVLVTGATGFIGRRTLEPLLARGFEVHAVARSVPVGDTGPVAWHRADLLDERERRALVGDVRASHLLHLAWYAEPGKFWMAPENADWVAATVDLVAAFARSRGHRAVLAGTCAEYDWTAIDGRLAENAPLAPATLYGVCKDATRRTCEGLGAQLGLSVGWGRVFFLYGPGEDERRLVSGVAKKLVTGERAQTSEGTQLRDFMHVDDVAGAFAALADSDVEGGVNVGVGEAVSIREVVGLVAEAAGQENRLDVGVLPMRRGDPPELVPDTSRLRNEVGYQPEIGLASGLAETVEWWRARTSGA